MSSPEVSSFIFILFHLKGVLHTLRGTHPLPFQSSTGWTYLIFRSVLFSSLVAGPWYSFWKLALRNHWLRFLSPLIWHYPYCPSASSCSPLLWDFRAPKLVLPHLMVPHVLFPLELFLVAQATIFCFLRFFLQNLFFLAILSVVRARPSNGTEYVVIQKIVKCEVGGA